MRSPDAIVRRGDDAGREETLKKAETFVSNDSSLRSRAIVEVP
jgi:hypothetical protein